MTISLASITSGRQDKPPIMAVYSVHGCGKTTLGASADRPIFMQTEDGLGMLDAPTFGMLRTYDELMQAIGSLYTEPHDFKTLVLDSADHAEPLIWAQCCKDNGWDTIEKPGYGRGYAAALDLWRVMFDGLRALRDEKGMTIVLLAHSMIQNFDSPETESYARYSPKLHKGASAFVQEACDAVFFCNYRVSTVKTDSGFNKKTVRGVGGSERVLYTTERPSHLAKNRYSMPDQLPMTWDAIAEHIPALANNQMHKKDAA